MLHTYDDSYELNLYNQTSTKLLLFIFYFLTMSASPSQRSSSPDTASTMTGNVNEDDAQQFQQIIRDRRCKFF